MSVRHVALLNARLVVIGLLSLGGLAQADVMDRYWRPELRIMPARHAPGDDETATSGHITFAPAVRARPAVVQPSPPPPPPRIIPWRYDGEGAPEHWAALKPEFALCGKGLRQSPVDLGDAIAVDLMPADFHYVATPLHLRDDGHTLRASLSGSVLEVNGRRFTLDELHVHRPAEEVIKGVTHDLGLHLVHHDADGHAAIVTVLMDRGDANPLVQTLLNHLPLESDSPVDLPEVLIDPALLLPEDRRYYSTMGSLTEPPCTEGVLWLVLRQPMTVSEEQLDIFKRLHGPNARPLQPANGRVMLGPR